MYVFINENEIIPYSGEILKRYVGKKLVKIIANPTDENLREFGYMPLIEEGIPEYDKETQCLDYHYEVRDNTIKKIWTVHKIQIEEPPSLAETENE